MTSPRKADTGTYRLAEPPLASKMPQQRDPASRLDFVEHVKSGMQHRFLHLFSDILHHQRPFPPSASFSLHPLSLSFIVSPGDHGQSYS